MPPKSKIRYKKSRKICSIPINSSRTYFRNISKINTTPKSSWTSKTMKLMDHQKKLHKSWKRKSKKKRNRPKKKGNESGVEGKSKNLMRKVRKRKKWRRSRSLFFNVNSLTKMNLQLKAPNNLPSSSNEDRQSRMRKGLRMSMRRWNRW